MSGDVDLDRIADFVGGALDGTPDAADVRHLISSDVRWAQAYAVVLAADSTIRAELGAAGPVEEAMPAEVVARLEGALVAEAAEPGSATDPAHPAHPTDPADPADPAHPVSDAPARRTNVIDLGSARRRRRRILLTAAAAILVLGAGGILAVPLVNRGATMSGTSSAGNADRQAAGKLAEDAGALAVFASGSDYQPATLGTAPLVRGARNAVDNPALPSGAVRPYDVGSQDQGPAAGVAGAGGTSGSDTAPPGAVPPAAIPAGLDRLAQVGARDTCLAALANQYGGHAIVADYALFSGRPAVIVIMDGTVLAGAGHTLAVVVGPVCGQDGRTTDELYHTVT